MAILAAVAGAIATGVIESSFSNSGGGGGGGNVYIPPNAAQAGINSLNTINSLPQYNYYAGNMPLANSYTAQLLGNPYQFQQQNAANQAGSAAGELAPSLQSSAQNLLGGVSPALFNQAANLGGLSNALVQSGFDPQSQLYNYLQAQNTNQTNAQLAAMGLGTSAAGAGLADQSNQQFNMNWQNQQLQRQLAAAQGATGLSNAMGSLSSAGANVAGMGANLGSSAQSNYLASGQLPYQTYSQNLNNMMSALSQLGTYGQQAAQIPQQMIADYNQYQGLGVSANAGVLGQQNINNQSMNALGSAIGQGVSSYINNNSSGSGDLGTWLWSMQSGM